MCQTIGFANVNRPKEEAWVHRIVGSLLFVAILVVAGCTETIETIPLPLPKVDAIPVTDPTATPITILTVAAPPALTADFEATVEAGRVAAVSARLATAVASLTLPTADSVPTASATPSTIVYLVQTPTSIPPATPTWTPTVSPTVVSMNTPTQTPTSTPTAILPTVTSTPVPSPTLVPTATPTQAPPTATNTPPPTATNTPTPTATNTPTPTATPRIVVIAGTFRTDNTGGTTAETLAECSPFISTEGRGKKYSNDGSWFGVNGAALCGTHITSFIYDVIGFLGIELQATRFPVHGIDECVIEVTGQHGNSVSAVPPAFRPIIGTYEVTATLYSDDGSTVLLAIKETGGKAPSQFLDYRLEGVCAG